MPVQGSADKRPNIPVAIVRETPKAWLLDVGGKEDVWFPKSQGEIYKQDNGMLLLFGEEWLMKDKGLL